MLANGKMPFLRLFTFDDHVTQWTLVARGYGAAHPSPYLTEWGWIVTKETSMWGQIGLVLCANVHNVIHEVLDYRSGGWNSRDLRVFVSLVRTGIC